jgi:hypothetical protein
MKIYTPKRDERSKGKKKGNRNWAGSSKLRQHEVVTILKRGSL